MKRNFRCTRVRRDFESAEETGSERSVDERVQVEPEDENGFIWYKYKGLLVHKLQRSAVRALREKVSRPR